MLRRGDGGRGGRARVPPWRMRKRGALQLAEAGEGGKAATDAAVAAAPPHPNTQSCVTRTDSGRRGRLRRQRATQWCLAAGRGAVAGGPLRSVWLGAGEGGGGRPPGFSLGWGAPQLGGAVNGVGAEGGGPSALPVVVGSDSGRCARGASPQFGAMGGPLAASTQPSRHFANNLPRRRGLQEWNPPPKHRGEICSVRRRGHLDAGSGVICQSYCRISARLKCRNLKAADVPPPGPRWVVFRWAGGVEAWQKWQRAPCD